MRTPASDTELVVLIGPDGRPAGTHPKATVHTTNTPLHYAFSCYLTRPDGQVRLTVEDDGAGIGEPPVDERNHHGLAIMRERARSIGGELDIVAMAQGGTRVCLRFAAAPGIAVAVTDGAAQAGGGQA